MIEYLIESHLRGTKAEHILDVGPGYAAFSRLSARVTGAHEITFLDCDKDVLEYQKAECDREGVRSQPLPIQLDDGELARVKGQFEVIHCQEVLEHLPNARLVLKALSHLLTPNGVMVISVPTKRSERWLKFIDPSYMKNEEHGHVNEFTEESLRALIVAAGLTIRTLIPAQPHYFIAHTWLFGSRMKIDGSTGAVITGGVRGKILDLLTRLSSKFFHLTGIEFWGRRFPRNYLVIASKSDL